MIFANQGNGALFDDGDGLYKILTEMGFFLSLLLICEVVRWSVKRGYLKSDRQYGRILWICSLVLCWFTVSITLILWNKWVMDEWNDAGYRFPVFYTMTHMFLKGCFAVSFFVCTQGSAFSLPRVRWSSIVGLSVAGSMTALDVVASNLSLLYISASYYTFLKSSALMFYLVLALIFRVEPLSVPVLSCVAFVCLGMFMMSYGETDFDWTGFILVVSSEVFAAVRWIVTQIMLQSEGVESMTAVLYMSPASFLTLFPCIMTSERSDVQAAYTDMDNGFAFLAFICLPGFLAFILLLAEVQLVRETSGLTLTVFGNLKSVCTILFAILVFGERTQLMQWFGLGIAVIGMLAYSRAKDVGPTFGEMEGLADSTELICEDGKFSTAGHGSCGTEKQILH